MAKKKQIGIIGASMLAAATLLGGAHQVTATAQTGSRVENNKKEALPEKQNATRPVQKVKANNLFSGDANIYKHIRTPKKNQRQIRKWKRQNQNAWH